MANGASRLRCAEEIAAALERLLQHRDCGTEEAELRWQLWADAAAKKPLRKEHHRGSPQSCAGECLMAAPWQSTIGKQQSTIGEPHGTIGKPAELRR